MAAYILYLFSGCLSVCLQISEYSSVPNRRVGRNKRARGKFLENIKRAGQNRRAGWKFSGKSINMQGGKFQ